MSQIERLGLMRNPDLSMRYVVALLETASEELDITRESHMHVLRAAALNPGMIGSSRMHGRKFWLGGDEGNPPFEEYGKMWLLSFEKWFDQPRVLYCFFKYIQTTPEIKLTIYRKLLEKDDDKEHGWLREEVIRSCDPFEDWAVLKAAWTDRREKCRDIAKERVGPYSRNLEL